VTALAHREQAFTRGNAIRKVINLRFHPDPNGWYDTNTVTREASAALYLVTRR
jgi:hypothetical protein